MKIVTDIERDKLKMSDLFCFYFSMFDRCFNLIMYDIKKTTSLLFIHFIIISSSVLSFQFFKHA